MCAAESLYFAMMTNLKQYDTGVDTFIECGPGQTLSGLVRKTLKGVNIYNVNDMESLKATCEKLGVTI